MTLVLSTVAPVLLYPKVTSAQVGGVTHDPIHTMVTKIGQWWTKHNQAIKEALRKAAAIAYRNALNLYLGQVARQTAEYVASGGQGQAPTFIVDKDYWNKLGDNMLGEFIDQAAQSTGFINQSLCDVIDPNTKFRILSGLDPKAVQMSWRQENRCSFSQIQRRLAEASHQQLLDISFNVTEGPVGQYQASLPTLVGSDSQLNDFSRTSLTSIINNITPIQSEFTTFVNDLSGGRYVFDQTGAEAEKNNLIEELATKVWGNDRTVGDNPDFLTYWEIQPSRCLALNQDAFCPDENCFAIGQQSSPDCPGHFVEYQSTTRRADDYAKQIVEWANTLDDMISSVDPTNFTPPQMTTLEDASKMFNPEGSDIGATLNLQGRSLAAASDAVKKDEYWHSLQGRMNDITTTISNLTKTPSNLVSDATRAMVDKGTAGPLTITGVAAADALGVFTNTLISKLLKQIFVKGVNPQPVPELAERGAWNGPGSIVTRPTQYQTRQMFADLAAVSLKGGGRLQLLEDFTTCPDDAGAASPTNCVLDNDFAQAVDDHLTIKEAIDKGSLHGDWLVGTQLGIKDSTLDYKSRYSMTNIKKLRRYRVVPLGLEIAAQKISSGELGVTDTNLSQVVGGFNQVSAAGDCDANSYETESTCENAGYSWYEDTFNSANNGCCFLCESRRPGPGGNCIECMQRWHPASNFCHLVNPNWVLKAQPFQCDAMAYSALPLPNSSERQQTCVDLKDCIQEDAEGHCQTWAYCTRERNVWRMGGTACDAQYASCQAYKRKSDSQVVSYLKNTVDFNNCDANNAGCKWYCQRYGKGLAANNQNDWACKEPGTSLQKDNQGNYSEISDPGNAIFFNRQVSTCSATAEGCSEYVRTATDSGTNLLPNASFEQSEKCSLDKPCASASCTCTYADGRTCSLNQKEISCSLLFITVPGPVNDFESTVTGWAIDDGEFVKDQPNAKSGMMVAKINSQFGGPYLDLNGSQPGILGVPLLDNTNYTFSVWVKNTDTISHKVAAFASFAGPVSLLNSEQEILANSGWQRISFTFNTGDYGNPADSQDLRWEIENSASSGYVYFDDLQLETSNNLSEYKEYGSTNKIYLKKAPDWMMCYDDQAVCFDDDPSNDNATCTNNDVNCYKFTLPCQKSEVGCELYTPANGDPPLPAVAKDENVCPAECVGYETFHQMPTNFEVSIDKSFIASTGRTCPSSEVGCEEFTNLDEVARGGEGREYYSYLRSCRKPDGQCAYYFTWVGSDITGYQLKRYYLQAGANGPQDVITNQRTIEDLWGKCDGADDLLTNPHCKQFYDSVGSVSYHIYENTISCSDDCHPLRKTTAVTPEYCPTTLGIPGVSYDASGICTYMAIPSEGIRCSQVNASCREYKGNAAYNVRQVFLDDFEQGSIDPWTSGEYSNESISFGGHSLRNLGSTSRPVQDLVSQGKSYLLTFWAKGAGTYTAIFSAGLQSAESESTISGDEWQEVKLGPTYLLFSPSDLTISGPANSFLDNILLKETIESVYLIKDSWTTPVSCDNSIDDPAGEACPADPTHRCLPGAMIGCQQYKDRAGTNQYFKSFSDLCRDEAVGCEALIETKNSSWPFKSWFNQDPPNSDQTDDATVPADQTVYLVNDSKNSCSVNDKGCQRFGLPTLSVDNTVVGWGDKYLKNDSDLYTQKPTLCQAPDLNCEEYTLLDSNASVYFKDPGEKLCEYKENINVGAEGFKSGWFKKGTNQACVIGKYCEGGANDNLTCTSDANCPNGRCKERTYQPDGMTYGVRSANDPQYEGWAGTCPTNQSTCTEFLDPLGEVVFSDDMETDDDQNNVADGWVKGCGGNIGACNSLCTTANQTPSLDVNEFFHGQKSQKITINTTPKQCQSYDRLNNICVPDCTASSLIDSDVVFSRSYNADDIPSLNFAPGRFYVFSAYGKTTDTTHGWQLLVREVYDSLDTVTHNLLASDLDTEDECLARNNLSNNSGRWYWGPAYSDPYPSCTHDTVASPKNVTGNNWNNWHSAHLRFIVDPRDYVGLGHLEFDLRGPQTGTANFDYVNLRAYTPYYYLDNNQLDKSSCNSQVGLADGCALFYDPNQPNFTYDSVASYEKSAGQGIPDTSVNAVTCQNDSTSCDSNLILKVRRDRVCGEWLSCFTSRSEWDKTANQYKEVCEAVGRCDKLVGQGSASRCGEVVDESTPTVLGEDVYKNRDISWAGLDYSGHSMFNYYPVEKLTERASQKYCSLALRDPCNNDNDCANKIPPQGTCSLEKYQLTYVDSQNQDKGVDGQGKKVDKSVRAYPEEDSPFKPVVKDDKTFSEVNFCEPTDPSSSSTNPQNPVMPDCQGTYVKAEYDMGIKYFNESNAPWNGICVSGDDNNKIGTQCVQDTDCGAPGKGSCSPLKGNHTVVGWRGYCLEPDPSKPENLDACITWWPKGSITGDSDLYNQFGQAGYIPNPNRMWYCGQRYIGDPSSNPNHLNLLSANPPWIRSVACTCQQPPRKPCECQYQLIPVTQPQCFITEDWVPSADGYIYYSYPSTAPLIYTYMVDDIDFVGSNNDFIIDQSDPTNCNFGWDCPGLEGDISLRASNNPEPWLDTASCSVGDDKDILTVKAFWNSDDSLSSIGVRFEDGTDNSGGVKILGGRIKLKNGCEVALKIGNSLEPAKVYTNRINHVRNYETLNFDGKDYSTQCGPWGSLSLDQTPETSSYIIENQNTCPAWSSTEPSGTVYTYYDDPAPETPNNPTDEYLHQLFVKPEDAYLLYTGTYKYVQQDLTAPITWDDRNSRYLPSRLPTIASVNCDLQGNCREDSANAITIGNSSSDHVDVTGIYNAILKFYAYADSNHMPLREIMIDWNGNGWSSSSPGSDDNDFKVVAQNHRGKGECNDTEFGRSSQACTENYFQLIHTYYCSGSSSPNWNPGLGACVFTPKVNVKDNWDKLSDWVSYGNTITVKPYSGW